MDSIGRTVPGVDARIVDDDFEERPPVFEGPVDEGEADPSEVTGELVVAGPNVTKGYAGMSEANEASFTRRDGKGILHRRR